MYEPGDFVLYEMKNELGVVKRERDKNASFCFFHTGGTASGVLHNMIVLLTVEEVLNGTFANDYAVPSLLERSARIILNDGVTNDLIDSSDVRGNIGGVIANVHN